MTSNTFPRKIAASYRLLYRRLLHLRKSEWTYGAVPSFGPWKVAGAFASLEEARKAADDRKPTLEPGSQIKILLRNRQVWNSCPSYSWERPLKDQVLLLFQQRRAADPDTPNFLLIPREEILQMIQSLGGEPPAEDWWYIWALWYEGLSFGAMRRYA